MRRIRQGCGDAIYSPWNGACASASGQRWVHHNGVALSTGRINLQNVCMWQKRTDHTYRQAYIADIWGPF